MNSAKETITEFGNKVSGQLGDANAVTAFAVIFMTSSPMMKLRVALFNHYSRTGYWAKAA